MERFGPNIFSCHLGPFPVINTQLGRLSLLVSLLWGCFKDEENFPLKIPVRLPEFHSRPRPTFTFPACHTHHSPQLQTNGSSSPNHWPLLQQYSSTATPFLTLLNSANCSSVFKIQLTCHLLLEDLPTAPGRGHRCCLLPPLVPSLPFIMICNTVWSVLRIFKSPNEQTFTRKGALSYLFPLITT